MTKHYSRLDVLRFLISFRYHFPPSFRGGVEYYYNPWSQGKIGIPEGKQKFTENEIRAIFDPPGAGVANNSELSLLCFKIFIEQKAYQFLNSDRGQKGYRKWRNQVITWINSLGPSILRETLESWFNI